MAIVLTDSDKLFLETYEHPLRTYEIDTFELVENLICTKKMDPTIS